LPSLADPANDLASRRCFELAMLCVLSLLRVQLQMAI